MAVDSLGEWTKGAWMCFFLGLFALLLSVLNTEATIEVITFERMRHYYKKRSMLRRDTDDIMPYFDNATERNVTTTSGKTAYLPCRVRHLGDRTVSWIRQKDLQVLTVDKFAYTSDQRYQIIHLDETDDWTLVIKYPQRGVAGLYECQINTVPKSSLFVNLNVVVSKATIIDGPAIYIKSGSSLNLTCLLKDSPESPDYLFWYRNGRVINYEGPRGIAVHTETSILTASHLVIRNAQPNDSGNYSCVPSNADPGTIAVHVLNGEHPAAMQDKKLTAGDSRLQPISSLLLLITWWLVSR